MESFEDYDVNVSNFYIEEMGEEVEHLLDNPLVKFIMYLTVLIISGASIVANLIVIALIAKRWSNLSVVNAFILAIVCVELISTIAEAMLEPMDYLLKFPKRNDVSCKTLLYASHVSSVLQTLMLAAFLLTLALVENVRLKIAVMIVSATTASAFILGLPVAVSAHAYVSEWEETVFCIDDWHYAGHINIPKLFIIIIEALSYSLAVIVYFFKSKKFRDNSERIYRQMLMLLVLSMIFFVPRFLTKIIIISDFYMVIFHVPEIIIAVYIVTTIGYGVKAVFFLFFHEELRRDFEGLFSCFKRTSDESYAIYNNRNL
jgi:hypothetical protein